MGDETIPGRIDDGRKIVTTAGTAEMLAADTPCKEVLIIAELDNIGYVVIGGSTVVAAASTRRGIPMSAGGSLEIVTNNLNTVYLDVTVDGDGVTYIYQT